MSRTLKRWIALVILAALAFAQASIAATACEMDRRTLSHAVASMESADSGCEARSIGNALLYSNRCLAHCTADLQIAGLPVAIVRSPADAAVLLAPPASPSLWVPLRLRPQPVAVPMRILLHSFLI